MAAPVTPPSRTGRRLAAVVLAFVLGFGVVALATSGQASPRVPRSDPVWSTRGRAILEAKREAARREADSFRVGRSNRAPVPADPSTAGPARKVSTWATGLFGPDDADLPPSLGAFRNVWKAVLSGRFIAVYAGARTEDRDAALVVVMTIDPATWGHTFERYDVPIAGPARITAAEGTVLTLASDGGTATVGFDVGTRTFR